ncbi:hypothetical protein BJ742DRAFT_178685 [Cladochytrium replicatum]|nr:hypothetical protein BJ742DRAFT_178685 [Cladochytrium replicatum]
MVFGSLSAKARHLSSAMSAPRIIKYLAVPAITSALYLCIDCREALRRAKAIAYASEFDKEYIYIVIGGGSAGCAVAARLFENPNVAALLIESRHNYLSDMRVNLPSQFPAPKRRRLTGTTRPQSSQPLVISPITGLVAGSSVVA